MPGILGLRRARRSGELVTESFAWVDRIVEAEALSLARSWALHQKFAPLALLNPAGAPFQHCLGNVSPAFNLDRCNGYRVAFCNDCTCHCRLYWLAGLDGRRLKSSLRFEIAPGIEFQEVSVGDNESKIFRRPTRGALRDLALVQFSSPQLGSLQIELTLAALRLSAWIQRPCRPVRHT